MKHRSIFYKFDKILLPQPSVFEDKGDFEVFKSPEHNFYRLANGIFIFNSKGISLDRWEHRYWKFFSPKQTKHTHFSFFQNHKTENLFREAQQRYREVHAHPLMATSLYDKNFIISEKKLSFSQILGDRDWLKYHEFLSKIHSKNHWVLNNGYKILKKISQDLGIYRFLCFDRENNIVGSFANIKKNNVVRFENFEISPSFRNKGFGKITLQFALKHAKEILQADYVVLTSSNKLNAQRLYLQSQFKVISNKITLLNY